MLTKVTWVGVHNRRGDYGNHLSKLYNLPMLGPDFFLLAMEHFTKKIPGPVSLKLVSGKPCHVGVERVPYISDTMNAIAKKGPIDLFALMSAGTNSRRILNKPEFSVSGPVQPLA